VANAEFCFPLPDGLSNEDIAPLLCAGLIGWRTLKLAERASALAYTDLVPLLALLFKLLYIKVEKFMVLPERATAKDRNTHAGWARAGLVAQMSYRPNHWMQPHIAPAGDLVPVALKASDKGATIVCGGIHMSDIPSFPYASLWEERSIRSVANLTRQDATEFLEVAAKIPIHSDVTVYDLKDANKALDDLRHGRFHGAAVLSMP